MFTYFHVFTQTKCGQKCVCTWLLLTEVVFIYVHECVTWLAKFKLWVASDVPLMWKSSSGEDTGDSDLKGTRDEQLWSNFKALPCISEMDHSRSTHPELRIFPSSCHESAPQNIKVSIRPAAKCPSIFFCFKPPPAAYFSLDWVEFFCRTFKKH